MEGKVLDNVLIIGGAAGIGRQIALDFAEKGCCTAVADIDQSALTDMTQQNQIYGFKADVSSWDSVSEMIEQVIDKIGSIDTLVFSAGITKKGRLEETNWALWEKTMAVNLHGLFFSIKAAAPHMIGRKKGKIVIIGSGSAITGSGGGIQYYASKGGAFGLMRSLVKELGEHQININVIAPRVIESQMLDSLYPTDELKQTVRNKIPIGRLGRPSDISELVQYLSSAQADYIHGQIFLLDGGRTYQGN
jgi:3-oxoacyl-[acyl-carrier protein] reductase